eukprot:774713-Rhodomonas_salina.1
MTQTAPVRGAVCGAEGGGCGVVCGDALGRCGMRLAVCAPPMRPRVLCHPRCSAGKGAAVRTED